MVRGDADAPPNPKIDSSSYWMRIWESDFFLRAGRILFKKKMRISWEKETYGQTPVVVVH
jgi:hypothetical protein